MDKRGPNGICVLEPIPDGKPKADKPIRPVGLREEAMREKIKEFQEKGWIVPSQSHWVSRGFLVPKPGTNKWQLVIDYRYVNTQLRGCEFPLPVIEDLFVKQAGKQLWTLLDLSMGSTKCLLVSAVGNILPSVLLLGYLSGGSYPWGRK